MTDVPSLPELAQALGSDAKVMRAWMRSQGWRSGVDHGRPWSLTADQVAILTAKYDRRGTGRSGLDDAVSEKKRVLETESDSRTPLTALTVRDLLSTYADVLAELRERNLVRTNNAPIGDLAEYCAAMVYDGLLAPNSEKSFDLTASDGRLVQVKVRQLRPNAPSALFSPLRSFGFDVAVFIVVDSTTNQVMAAREWTAEEVQQHGSFKAHTNGTTVPVSRVLTEAARGVDLTASFAAAWDALLARTRG